MEREALIALAMTMRQKAYCPYSHFAVGAVLVDGKGDVYTGCNIESAAYAPTLCAERVALAKAISEGGRDFIQLAVASSGEDYCVPCGVCRQMLWEFAPDLEIICINCYGESCVYTLRELLPHAFDASQL